MNRFAIPKWVLDLKQYETDYKSIPHCKIQALKNKLQKFNHPNPVVSILIPAWNEEKNILRTLASFAHSTLDVPAELIVVNNNSTDDTQKILDMLEVQSYFQPIQGISVTRQMLLEKSKGQIILNADADSIYPPDWGAGYVKALSNNSTSVTYGRYSFIPSAGNSRIALAIHEIIAESLFMLRRNTKDCVNVMGFNFAMKRNQALEVGGFSKSKMKWEDGMMAKKLSEKYGQIVLVDSVDARVWTSDRRLMADGSLFKAFVRRIKKELVFLHELFLPTTFKPLTKVLNQ
ncbi:MAG: glycosyltransferase family 2 protein [Bacteroidota bacterium]|nr:glycosyltransferase family 2 protein [Bacteroidota bacterium]